MHERQHASHCQLLHYGGPLQDRPVVGCPCWQSKKPVSFAGCPCQQSKQKPARPSPPTPTKCDLNALHALTLSVVRNCGTTWHLRLAGPAWEGGVPMHGGASPPTKEWCCGGVLARSAATGLLRTHSGTAPLLPAANVPTSRTTHPAACRCHGAQPCPLLTCCCCCCAACTAPVHQLLVGCHGAVQHGRVARQHAAQDAEWELR